LGRSRHHLETIKKYYPNLRFARGTTLKAFGEKKFLTSSKKRFLYFTRYNTIDNNVIERVLGDQDDKETSLTIKFLYMVWAAK
jgi:phosphate starvation-inducible PhoH-like protein